MELLASMTVRRPDGESEIRLYHGDLAAIPPEESVDLVVVSAFPNDYAPTVSSLIGAFHRRGLSVAALALDKSHDLRTTFGCWFSKPLPAELAARFSFKQLLCFEPLTRGSPPEVVGEVFRCLMPMAWGDPPIRTIALPLIASGDAQVPASVMFEPLISAAVKWLERGLPIDTIKIVEFDSIKADDLRRRFEASKPYTRVLPPSGPEPKSYDVFMSYSRKDQAEMEVLHAHLRKASPTMRVFVDRLEIKPGVSWQDELDRAILASAKVVALYSPTYLASKVCQEEFALARAQHRERADVLHPIYLRTADLMGYMTIINYLDCREGDASKLTGAAQELVEWHQRSQSIARP